MTEAAKKAAPRKTAAKAATVTHLVTEEAVEAELLVPLEESASWLALQWLLPRAFPNAQWSHAVSVIEDSGLPQEVQDVLREAYHRAEA